MSTAPPFLDAAAIARRVSFEDHVRALEQAFVAHAEERTLAPGVLHVPGLGGGFHVKAAGLVLAEGAYVAVKVNGNFPANPGTNGRPTIQGVLVLADARTGTPLLLLDSAEITLQRTGAATALAARLGARRGASRAAILGCGVQARTQFRALSSGRTLTHVTLWDLRPEAAEAFARELRASTDVPVELAPDPASAVRSAELVATCTPSRTPFLRAADVRPGTFIAAVGADNPEKQELEPALLAGARVIADVRAQALTMGDTHHAVAAGAMRAEDLVGELAELLTGLVQARRSEHDVVVFDSTGTALEDVASAVAVLHSLRTGR